MSCRFSFSKLTPESGERQRYKVTLLPEGKEVGIVSRLAKHKHHRVMHRDYDYGWCSWIIPGAPGMWKRRCDAARHLARPQP